MKAKTLKKESVQKYVDVQTREYHAISVVTLENKSY